ncbi:MAG: hypothetical protein AB7I48_16230 [Planctomycetaceae bacterium]
MNGYVNKPNPEDDRRLKRRMPLHDEWEWLRLITSSEDAQRYGVDAGERVLLYATTIQTGLRSNELRSLTRGRLFLDREQPFITCSAGNTENCQYIKSDLASDLQ